ncbi:histidine phosphatase family protein [uncultured Desulfobacter sp.]|uniref:SixA phosphatase family protein n=1 Tax=uncultured Desulfobacter sp. TaxID=240139 RepID=UPI0029F50F4C|nr:histidine phosphatase family protein [uncultured Desulfobacter sp.]
MKTLHLIRHAKSSWKDEQLADIDRPLAPRGIRACAVMASEIAKTGCNFSNVFTSPAQRATETIERIAGYLKNISFTWTISEKLYTFSAHELLAFCRNDLPENINQAVIVGHNPAFHNFCNRMMTGPPLKKMPTCAYARLEMDANAWNRIGPGTMRLTAFLTPKMFR